MLVSTYLFIGATALLSTAFAVSTQTQAAAWYDEYADPIAMVGGLLGFYSWAMLAYGSLNVEPVDGGVVFSFSMPAVTLWCLAMSIPPLYVALTGPFEVVKRATGTMREDV